MIGGGDGTTEGTRSCVDGARKRPYFNKCSTLSARSTEIISLLSWLPSRLIDKKKKNRITRTVEAKIE